VQTQAVFALKGKPLNTYGLSKKVIYENEEFHLLQSALNIEEGLDGLRYNKIVIATDADVDGMHIRLLLISFFLQFFPDLIRNGHLFILETPLFRVRNKKETIYCYSEQEKQAASPKLGARTRSRASRASAKSPRASSRISSARTSGSSRCRCPPAQQRRAALVLHGQEHARAAGLHHRQPRMVAGG
jgi:DNA gyrase/topoisomerase IV subunit B